MIAPRRIRTMTLGLALGVALAPCASASTAALGPVWQEDSREDEAGSLPPDAQVTTGRGELAHIVGKLDDNAGPMPDFEDMYLIRIPEPALFGATTLATMGGAADFDTRLWLFRPVGGPFTAFGRLANDDVFGDDTGQSLLLPVPTDGSPPITMPGLYYIAISGAGRAPISFDGIIFDIASPVEISVPDGPGGDEFVSGWVGPMPDFGEYDIRLTGVTFAFLPCPADVTGDGVVNVADFIAVLTSFGPCSACPEDVNDDGEVNTLDLLAVLFAWGVCP